MQITKTFPSCKVFVYVLLYYFTFQGPTYLNCHLHKYLLLDKSVSVVIVFLFLGGGFANTPPTFLISRKVQTRYSNALKYSQQYI